MALQKEQIESQLPGVWALQEMQRGRRPAKSFRGRAGTRALAGGGRKRKQERRGGFPDHQAPLDPHILWCKLSYPVHSNVVERHEIL